MARRAAGLLARLQLAVAAVCLVWAASVVHGEPDYIRWAIGNATSPERVASLLRIQNHVRAFEEAVGLLPPGSVPPPTQPHGRYLGELDCFDSCLDTLYLTNMEFCDMIDYKTCPVGTSVADAQAAAEESYNKRINLPSHAGVADCRSSLRAFSCYTYFPKCEWTAISYTTCKSTCENYFKACQMDEGSGCDGYQGVGPSPTCTGAATSLSVPAVFVAAVLVLMSLFTGLNVAAST